MAANEEILRPQAIWDDQTYVYLAHWLEGIMTRRGELSAAEWNEAIEFADKRAARIRAARDQATPNSV